ncbi:hypothetical protein JW859_04145 [bacterium]|nr:hypothetical protein [bacterium]
MSQTPEKQRERALKLHNQGRFDEALDAWLALLAELRQAETEPRLLAETYLSTANGYLQVMKYAEGEKLLDKAEELFAGLELAEQITAIHMRKGRLALIRGDLTRAHYLLDLVEQTLTDQSPEKLVAEYFELRGRLASSEQDYIQAVADLTRAAEHRRSLGNKQLELISWLNVAAMKLELGQDVEAEQEIKDIIARFKQMGNFQRGWEGRLLLNLLYLRRQDFATARDEMTQCLTDVAEQVSAAYQFEALIELSNSELQLGDWHAARRHLQSALRFDDLAQAYAQRAELLIHLAMTYLMAADLAEARHHLESAQENLVFPDDRQRQFLTACQAVLAVGQDFPAQAGELWQQSGIVAWPEKQTLNGRLVMMLLAGLSQHVAAGAVRLSPPAADMLASFLAQTQRFDRASAD